MTRFGVMKHLRVLEDAGLVVTRRQGREKLHFLNPVPIRLIHDRWIDKYTERRVSALADLKTELEEPHDDDDRTDDAGLPGVHQGDARADLGGDHEARVHGALLLRRTHRPRPPSGHYALGPNDEVWGDDAVLEFDPPRRLVHGWRSLYDPELADEQTAASPGRSSPRTAASAGSRSTHDQLESSPKTAASVSGAGWMMVLSGLKTLLETGRLTTKIGRSREMARYVFA